MEEIEFSNGARAIPTELEDCYIIKPAVFGDNRGYFSPYYIDEQMKSIGFKEVVQTNRSKSAKNVLRGLHFQEEPFAQAKIVEVINGAAVDVVVDIREGSPTYGKSIAVLLMPYDKDIKDSGNQLFVPRGFAHGFVSLKDDTVFQYLVDNKYAPESEGGILWNDDVVKDTWDEVFASYDLSGENLNLSEKDKVRKPLSLSPTYFRYGEK